MNSGGSGFIASLAIWVVVQLSFTCLTWGDGCVAFDVPAVVESCEVLESDAFTVDPNIRLVRIDVPCSTLVQCRNEQQVLQLMLRVRGLSPGMQVSDYLPQTQTYSEIDGPIAVETNNQKTANLGIDANGTASEVVKLKASAGLGNSNGRTQRYQKIPEQKLLVASGTISRGMGVYYKFRHTNQTTLEGGHLLSITFRVPATWRGGLLRIDCQACGSEKYLLGTDDDFVAGSKTFVLATYLKGDRQAQQVANQYAQLESQLHQNAAVWSRHQSKKKRDPLAQFGELFAKRNSKLPENWVDKFMLYDSRSIKNEIRPYLSKSLQRATDQFVAARLRVLRLNR